MLKKIDPQIIELAKKGNQKAISDIIDNFWQPIFRYVFKKTLDLKHAINSTEKTFVRGLSALKHNNFENSDSFGIWLYRIAKDESDKEWGLFTKKKNIYLKPSHLSYLKGELKEASFSISQNENFIKMKKLLGKLASPQRDIIVLHYMEQESLENIAKIFETTVDAVKKIKAKAMDKLELFMSKDIKRARI